MPKTPRPNPQIAKDEILQFLKKEGLSVFHVEPDMWPENRSVWWDTEREPDYKKFVAIAKAAGVKQVLYLDEDLQDTTVKSAQASLEMARLDPEEYREYAHALAEFRSYEGFTCRVCIGYALESIFYWYDLEALWYMDFLDLIDELHAASFAYRRDDDEDGEPPMGNFYSNN